MASVFERIRSRSIALWLAVKNERASPRQIGLAVGMGAFIGCTPALGFDGGLAVGVATLFRLNRLYCWVGSRLSNLITLPWIVLAEIQVAHRLRTGVWLELTTREVLDRGSELVADWLIGLVPVGVPLASAAGMGGYVIARWRQRTRAPLPLPSSESQPSSSKDPLP